MDWAQQNLDKLAEEEKEFKTALKEAEEQLFDGVPEDGWDYLKVDGKVVYTRTMKPGQKRFDVTAFRAQHPDLADEFTKQESKPKIDRVR